MSAKRKKSADILHMRHHDTNKKPTGHIVCAEKPMAYWLPDDIMPESIGLKAETVSGTE